MHLRWLIAIIAAGATCSDRQAVADFIMFSSAAPRGVTAAEVAGGAPARGLVLQIRATTDGDIISIDDVKLTLGPGVLLYDHPFGTADQANQPTPALVGLFPALGSDSWVDTPGPTTLFSGVPFPGDGVNTTYGDLTDDGPQQEFVFSQFTVHPATANVLGQFSFTGSMTISGGDGLAVYTQLFDYTTSLEGFQFPVPEPSPVILLLPALGCMAAARDPRRDLST